jgi:hypothetical protein
MDGNCKEKEVVYGATVVDTTTGEQETYTGLTGGMFKARWNQHMGDFRHVARRHCTTLAAHVWRLKEAGRPYTITWRVLTRAAVYNTTTQMCRLCLMEKYMIMFAPATASLNSSRELFSSCRHRRGQLIGARRTGS